MNIFARFLRDQAPDSNKPAGKICSVCGRENPPDAKFCVKCSSEFLSRRNRYDGFLSYRRATGSDLASLLKSELQSRFDKHVFLDVKELQVGNFDEKLLLRIEETPNFILILSKASLDRCAEKSDWLKREIVHALKTQRNIIPVFTEGFSFPGEEVWALLPPEMRVLPSLNGVSYTHIHQDSAILKIASFMVTEPAANGTPPGPKRILEPFGDAGTKASSANEAVASRLPDSVPSKGPDQPHNSAPSGTEVPAAGSGSLPVAEEDSRADRPRTSSAGRRATFKYKKVLFASGRFSFRVANKEPKRFSFLCHAGSAIPVFHIEDEDKCGRMWYNARSADNTDLWYQGSPKYPLTADDQRVFFKIAETGHCGYLMQTISGDTVEEVQIVDELLGDVKVKTEQITSIRAQQGEFSLETSEVGNLSGKLYNYGNYNSPSYTMGPCLVTKDAIIALVRTKRTGVLTLQRVPDQARPATEPELIYWDRTQLGFRLVARGAIGHFPGKDVDVDGYIRFAEKSLGWMGISIPMIKKITVANECCDAPVIVETFAGNIYTGTCPDQFSLSGTVISFDKVKSLVLEAVDR